uniref:DUF5694 domain-containing protein n=1 Tax=Roseihalotalea indica TaxID=2867963 RepID=A0AA49JEK6_9BACT|nr:DUF5694 domain-containing protein [Tunicatimonas sp. TK19036]
MLERLTAGRKIGRLILCLLSITNAHSQAVLNTSCEQPVDQAKIVVLGMFHFASKENLLRQSFDDIQSNKSQRDIKELVNRLAKFAPTKIAVERPYYTDEELNQRYQLFLEGKYNLTPEETDQIAFRLAKKLGHKRLYTVYHPGGFEVDSAVAYAQNHAQACLYDSIVSIGRRLLDTLDAKIEDKGIIGGLKYFNSQEAIALNHLTYFYLSRIGDRSNRIGADLVADWYEVNLKVFSNICDLAKDKNDRVLVIYGQGHSKILSDLIRSAPTLELVDIAEYLE